MPKATWGAGDNPLTADDIEGAERPEVRTRYSGPLPPAGTYRFTIRRMKKQVSAKGNDMIVVRAELDGSWKPNHKQYDGANLFDNVVLTKANAQNVANFLDAIGATSTDLMKGVIVDDAGYITKFGRLGDPEDIQVYITVQQSRPTAEFPNPRLETGYAPYLMVDEEDGEGDGADGDGVEVDPPF